MSRMHLWLLVITPRFGAVRKERRNNPAPDTRQQRTPGPDRRAARLRRANIPAVPEPVTSDALATLKGMYLTTSGRKMLAKPSAK